MSMSIIVNRPWLHASCWLASASAPSLLQQSPPPHAGLLDTEGRVPCRSYVPYDVGRTDSGAGLWSSICYYTRRCCCGVDDLTDEHILGYVDVFRAVVRNVLKRVGSPVAGPALARTDVECFDYKELQSWLGVWHHASVNASR